MRWTLVVHGTGAVGHRRRTTAIVHTMWTRVKTHAPSTYATSARVPRTAEIGKRWASRKMGLVIAAGTYQYPKELRISTFHTSTVIGSLMLSVLSRYVCN